jgi:hypothetical protein
MKTTQSKNDAGRSIAGRRDLRIGALGLIHGAHPDFLYSVLNPRIQFIIANATDFDLLTHVRKQLAQVGQVGIPPQHFQGILPHAFPLAAARLESSL